jgi:hypothetical protein
MPRAFDSDDLPSTLSFTENVSCPVCDEIFESLFVDYTQSQCVEDLTEPPGGNHECPTCGYRWSSDMTGWMFFTEAG